MLSLLCVPVSYQSQELTILKQWFRPRSGLGRGGSLPGFTRSALWRSCVLSAFCLDIKQHFSPFLWRADFWGGAGMRGNFAQPLLGNANSPGTWSPESGWRMSCCFGSFSVWFLAAWGLCPLATFLSVRIKIQIFISHVSSLAKFVQSSYEKLLRYLKR